jgi:ABC-type transport system involved in multi-copper enzyme maturation permease subunit
MNLFEVEVHRFTARPAMRIGCVIVALLIIAGGSLAFAFSSRDVEGATRKERARAAAEHQACLAEAPGDVMRCGEFDADAIHADPRVHLSAIPEVFTNVAGNLIVLALVFGASFIGAEWHHRTMTATLTWESRRARVALAKIAAAATVSFFAVIALEALLSGSLLPAALFRGTTEGIDGPWLTHTISVGVRVAVLGAFASSLGASLGLVSRNTAFAIGISFLWIAVLEGIVRGTRPGWGRWLIGDNASSFIGAQTDTGMRSGLAAGLLLSFYVASIGWVAVAAFRRRDVA